MDERLSVLLGLTNSDIKIVGGDPRVQPLVMTTIADNSEEVFASGRICLRPHRYAFWPSMPITPSRSYPTSTTRTSIAAPPVRIGGTDRVRRKICTL